MEKVISNDDLLIKLFLCLPIKSLLRFKSVSKHWRSTITSSHLVTLHNSNLSYISGLLCHRSSCYGLILWTEWTKNNDPGLDFIPFDNKKFSTDISHLKSITQIPNLSGIIILNSCNGLLLCLGYNEADAIGGYHVLNPSTKQFETLPDPRYLNCLEGLGFFYDPSKSPHFKVVCICSFTGIGSDSYQIEIYSSETKKWTSSGERFTTSVFRLYLSGGVYWNGAINWMNAAAEPMYFNIDEERIGLMPLLPQNDNIWYGQYYFGESHGHLHFVDFFSPATDYNVYEMKKDYSEWFTKYRVDLTPVATDYPEMLVPGGNCHSSYSIISILRKKYDEGSFMVLFVHGKFIAYKFINKSYTVIYNVKAILLCNKVICYQPIHISSPYLPFHKQGILVIKRRRSETD